MTESFARTDETARLYLRAVGIFMKRDPAAALQRYRFDVISCTSGG
jgi:hypothetical protein